MGTGFVSSVKGAILFIFCCKGFFSFMAIVLKTVGLLRRSCFVLPKGKCLDLVSIFNCLHESELVRNVSFDENFKGRRIILKQEGFSVACFGSGKVLVYGLAEDKEVERFLKLVWKGFFCKNLATM